MQPTLAWLDFNTAEQLWNEPSRFSQLFGSRAGHPGTNLGLGGIRDSFSDHFFPGTSTIQTRLRYLFFIPWIYQDLEKRRTPSREVVQRRGRESWNWISLNRCSVPTVPTLAFSVQGLQGSG